jgi:phosphoglycolate phosphatase-like HAD superfamily hydrolase
MLPKDIRFLVFDMDGTIIDSMSSHADIFSSILWRKFGVAQDLSRTGYFNTAGMSLDEQFIYMLELLDIKQEVDINALADEFWNGVDELEPVSFPDTVPALKQLRANGYELCVISSCTPQIVKSKLAKSGLDKYFLLALGTDKNLQNMAKGLGHFTIISDSIGLTGVEFRKNVAMIGDAEYDMKIAKQAGILGIGRITGDNQDALKKAGADLLIHNLKELAAMSHLHTIH